MIVRRSFNPSTVFAFTWPNALMTAMWAGAVWAAYEQFGWRFLAIPFLPVATIGTAVAFYVGFKNNSSYDRLWEARKIWGAVVNASRSWAIEVRALVGHRQRPGEPDAVAAQARRMVLRHLAWVNVLRLQLRTPNNLNAGSPDLPQIRTAARARAAQTDPHEDAAHVLARFVAQEEAALTIASANPAAELLRLQVEDLTELKRRGWLDDFEHSDLKRHVIACVDSQGAAERIKTFPFPRQYGNFSVIFVRLFICLLPFGLLRELDGSGAGAWLVIPFSVLISWVFYSMEQVGDASENPFEGGVNDVPMTAMCRNIEIELRGQLGDQDLPERLQPTDGVLL